MRRLLRILNIQEEQSRAALETALSELHRLERAQVSIQERGRGGRRLVAGSAMHGQIVHQLVDRLAGLEETLAAARTAKVLAARAAEAEQAAALRREEFLLKRIERRQTEALVQKTEAADAVQAGRRSQQSLDDWYLNRQHRAAANKTASEKDE
jgi:hypothetical protein